MSSESENNRRIAKNTLYLYIRMFITMLVGLYTSRVVLNTLGVSDYGVYNVMGGIIGMLVYVNSLLSGGTSRFLTMSIGRGDMAELKNTFSLANTLAVAAAVIILVLGETVGLWFMNNKLNIDPGRMDAANWVYQCALASCVIGVLQTPYNASIIAHEKMSIYAYMSIFDVVMKLVIVFMLKWFDFDKLKLYSLLILSVSLLNFFLYRIICSKQFEECGMSFYYEKKKFKEMMGYSGWNMVGAFANVLNNNGLNILLNIFFGTVVNAARGIALQVSSIVQQFYNNFQIASRPQIMKYYAQKNIDGMSRLICNTSKYCGYLLLCLIIPIFFNIDDFLVIWLGQSPENTSWFTRLILLQVLFQAIDLPVGMGIHAVGRMKLPNLSSAVFYLSVFPLSYLAFKRGAGPLAGYAVYLSFTPCILLVDLLILKKYAKFKIGQFLLDVLMPMASIMLVGSLLSFFSSLFIKGEGVLFFLVRCFVSFSATSVAVLFLGLSKHLRERLFVAVKSKLTCCIE